MGASTEVRVYVRGWGYLRPHTSTRVTSVGALAYWLKDAMTSPWMGYVRVGEHTWHSTFNIYGNLMAIQTPYIDARVEDADAAAPSCNLKAVADDILRAIAVPVPEPAAAAAATPTPTTPAPKAVVEEKAAAAGPDPSRDVRIWSCNAPCAHGLMPTAFPTAKDLADVLRARWPLHTAVAVAVGSSAPFTDIEDAVQAILRLQGPEPLHVLVDQGQAPDGATLFNVGEVVLGLEGRLHQWVYVCITHHNPFWGQPLPPSKASWAENAAELLSFLDTQALRYGSTLRVYTRHGPATDPVECIVTHRRWPFRIWEHWDNHAFAGPHASFSTLCTQARSAMKHMQPLASTINPPQRLVAAEAVQAADQAAPPKVEEPKGKEEEEEEAEEAAAAPVVQIPAEPPVSTFCLVYPVGPTPPPPTTIRVRSWMDLWAAFPLIPQGARCPAVAARAHPLDLVRDLAPPYDLHVTPGPPTGTSLTCDVVLLADHVRRRA